MEAFIDPVTGCVGLNNKQLASLLTGDSIAELKNTDSLLRSFLHESTHHASLIGDVGSAYAALSLGTEATNLDFPGRPGTSGPTAINLQTRDWVLHHLFKTFYIPLLEGLAIFGEYDLYSCPVDVESAPLMHAKNLYLVSVVCEAVRESAKAIRPTANDGEARAMLDEIANTRERHINSYLRAQRLTADAVSMKQALLSAPLLNSSSDWSHYLLGYLATKGLYARCRSYRPFRYSTLFHVAAQMHFFRDPIAASALVSIDDLDAVKVQVTVHDLVEHIQDRLGQLFSRPQDALLAVQAAISGEPTRELDPMLQILCGLRTARELNPMGLKFLGFRHILRHGYTTVQLKHDTEKTHVHALDGAVMGICGRVPNAQLANEGSVELVQTSDGLHQALVVLAGDGLVSVRCLRTGEWNRPDQVEMFDEMPSAARAHALLRDRRSGVWRHEDCEEFIVETVKQSAGQIDAFGKHILLQLAFPLEPTARHRACGALREAGLATIFPAEIRELATYSLAFGGEGLPISEGCSLLMRTETACRKRIDYFNARALETTGVRLFEVDEAEVAFSRI